MSDETTMMDIIGTILLRLVTVALFIVIAILALLFMRSNTDMHMGLVAVLSIVVGVVGAVLLRLLFAGLSRLGRRSSG
ncbi:hypothetical protein [Brevibacterium atlanticum]|uniref:hypothetical protein n=1 Tax=Brevibacterium atlanticum TaxID=2697563 RepID=UPI00141FD171|nr:hypothetical protein [Brevibacterium atlanticum]